MDNYKIVELDNNEKYIIIDTINHENNVYLLLSKLSEDEKEFSEELIYCKKNIRNNTEYLEIIEDENESSFVESIFETKLKNVKNCE